MKTTKKYKWQFSNQKNINKCVLTIAGILVLSTVNSCKKFVEVQPPINSITASEVFSDDNSANSAILGMYTQMMNTVSNFSSGATTIYAGLSSDEIYPTSTTNTDEAAIYSNAIQPTNTSVYSSLYAGAYKIIYIANACIENLSISSGVSQASKIQLTAEAKFARALSYFYLTNFFGDVSLETSSDYKTNATLPRTAQDQVYSQIISDLQDAESNLPTTYIGTGRVRANKWSAAALLARVYLYQKNYSKAISEATEIINSGSYSLVSNLNNVFLAGSNEAILQFMPNVPSFNTTEGSRFIPSSATALPKYVMSNYFLNSFEPGDLRQSAWLKSNTVKGVIYFYPFKYKVGLFAATITEYYMVLRFAEQYLIRSEANAQLNNVSSAVTDLNMIRQRAGLSSLSSNLSQSSCLTAIAQERKIELFAEWGHRWFDLKRTGQIDAVIGAEKTGWKPTAALFPIYQGDILLNPLLTQNPGY